MSPVPATDAWPFVEMPGLAVILAKAPAAFATREQRARWWSRTMGYVNSPVAETLPPVGTAAFNHATMVLSASPAINNVRYVAAIQGAAKLVTSLVLPAPKVPANQAVLTLIVRCRVQRLATGCLVL